MESIGNIKVISMVLGMIATNCYFLYRDGNVSDDGKIHGIFVDPADDGDRVYEALDSRGFAVDLILLTHAHFDHIGGAEVLKKLSGAQIWCLDREERLCTDVLANLSTEFGSGCTVHPDRYLHDGEEITSCDMSFRVIATPGHTIGSCCYYFDDGEILISGDTLFEESVGRTDFPTGSSAQLVNSLIKKLLVLPDDTTVYPGHGGITSIEHEKSFNPYAAGFSE